jgi:large subunit ribosomal protein L10
MKKLGLIFKEASENRIKNTAKESSAILVIKYAGISSPALSALRQALKGSRARLFVPKNNVASRAFKGNEFKALAELISGPCGLVFIQDEPVAACKVLAAFSKEHEQFKLEGGILEDKVLQKKDIEAMASLPSKEVLRAQVVCTLNAPITQLVLVLKTNLRNFVYCLEQIKQKKPN